MTKSWWQSKILWLNVLTFLVNVLTLTEILAVVPKDWFLYIDAGVAILNMALRMWFTNTKLTK